MNGGVGVAISRRPFKIDGVTIPTPSEYSYNEEDLSTEGVTGRTLDGVMHKDVVSVKDTYSCTWKSLSWQDAATLLTAVRGKTRVSFRHADPRVPNSFIIKDFYIGKREATANSLNHPTVTWKSIKMTFIEI